MMPGVAPPLPTGAAGPTPAPAPTPVLSSAGQKRSRDDIGPWLTAGTSPSAPRRRRTDTDDAEVIPETAHPGRAPPALASGPSAADVARRMSFRHALPPSSPVPPPRPTPDTPKLPSPTTVPTPAPPGDDPPTDPRHPRWGLPLAVAESLASSLGPRRAMYDWQARTLVTPGVLRGCNLVYTAPTGGGKSLVAELLLVRRVLSTRRGGLLVLPFVAVCAERHRALAAALRPTGVDALALFGGGGGALPPPGSGAYVAVCTIERANAVVCHLVEDGRLGEICCVAVDELHMTGDDSRGYLLELLLTKLLFWAKPAAVVPGGGGGHALDSPGGSRPSHPVPTSGGPAVSDPPPWGASAPISGGGGVPESSTPPLTESPAAEGLQIIAMSATLPDAPAVAAWLRAALSVNDARPVPLSHHIVDGGMVYTPCRDEGGGGWTLAKTRELLGDPRDPRQCDGLAPLIQEVVNHGRGALLFCPSRAACPGALSRLLGLKAASGHLGPPLVMIPTDTPLPMLPAARGDDTGSDSDGDSEPESVIESVTAGAAGAAVAPPMSAIAALRAASVGALTRLGGPLALELARAVATGGAFHHAGLSSEERSIVESAFRSGAVRLLACTSTLSAGVNLPAARVFFREPFRFLGGGKAPLDGVSYAQMAGRAGRAGYDASGESYLILTAEGRKMGLTVHHLLGMVTAPLPGLASSLAASEGGVRRAVLEAAASGAVRTTADLGRYLQCTWLLSGAAGNDAARAAIMSRCVSALTWLARWGFLRPPPDDAGAYEPQPLGLAAHAASAAPDCALLMLHDLRLARDAGVVLSGDLHLCYLCVPEGGLDIKRFAGGEGGGDAAGIQGARSAANARFGPAGRATAAGALFGRVAHRVGLTHPDRAWLDDWMLRGGRAGATLARWYAFSEDHFPPPQTTPAAASPHDTPQHRALRGRALLKLLDAEILARLVAEQPLAVVAAAAGVEPGQLQAFQEGAARTASALAVFCTRFGWADLGELLSKFGPRLAAGARGDLAALTDIPGLRSTRARALYAVGLTTPEAVASSSHADIAALFVKAAAAGSKSFAAKKAESKAAAEALRGARAVMTARARQLLADAAVVLDRPETDAGRGAAPGTDSGWVAAAVTTELGLESVMSALPGQPAVAFAPDVRPGVSEGAPPTLHGLAVCGRRPLVHYIPLSTGRGPAWLPRVLAFLATPGGPTKVTFGLKTAFKALAAAAAASDDAVITGSAPGGTPWVGNTPWAAAADAAALRCVNAVAPPVEDARLLAWLLCPESWTAPESAPPRGRRPPLSPAALCPGLKSLLAGEGVPPGSYCVTPAPGGRLSEPAIGACRTAAAALVLSGVLRPRIAAARMGAAVVHESRCAGALAAMECWGGPDFSAMAARAAMGRLARCGAALEDRVGSCLPDTDPGGGAHRAATVLSNPGQVAHLLFHTHRFAPPPGRPGAEHSTRAEVLIALTPQGPARAAACGIPAVATLPSDVAEWRTVKKLVDMLRAAAPPGSGWERPPPTGGDEPVCRVAPTILQTATETGRLATEKPNLLCMPKDRAFELTPTQPGPGSASHPPVAVPRTVSLRAAFVARPGCVLLSCDYKQLELRLMAHFSGDGRLVALLSDATTDPFRAFALWWAQAQGQAQAQAGADAGGDAAVACPAAGLFAGVRTAADVTGRHRAAAKALCYGLLYGKGAELIGVDLGVAAPEAAALQASFLAALPELRDWLGRAVRDCRGLGTNHGPGRPGVVPYVTTLLARRRYLPAIAAAAGEPRVQAERRAVNTICQGSAADAAKAAMADVAESIAQARAAGAPEGRCRLLLQIHDELLLEVDARCASAVGRMVKARMEGVAASLGLRVPLPVLLRAGPTWGDLREETEGTPG